MGDYFRVKMDDRDLNYNKYYTEGDKKEALLTDYTSHNTRCLSVKEVKEMLLKLPEVVAELK
jgi:UDP-glucose 4-epimerase